MMQKSEVRRKPVIVLLCMLFFWVNIMAADKTDAAEIRQYGSVGSISTDMLGAESLMQEGIKAESKSHTVYQFKPVSGTVSGKCGDNIFWELKADGTLSITGTGAMYEISWDHFDNDGNLLFNMTEWAEYSDSIKEVDIAEGITDICEYAFEGCIFLETVKIPSTVSKIGGGAFQSCRALKEVSVPEGVTELDGSVFYGCVSLSKVSLPSSLKEIANNALSDCYSLEHISIPDNVSVIGEAFMDCKKLKSIVIPSKVKEIYDSCFRGCTSLESVILGDHVKTISSEAFYDCTSLKSFQIPASVADIAGTAFSGCTALEEFIVDHGNKKFKSEEGILFNKKGTKLICYPGGKTGTLYTVPGGIKEIGKSAFDSCQNLTQVTLPTGLKEIGEGAFSGCSGLTSVSVPEGISVLKSHTFSRCDSLKSIILPSSLTRIEAYAFMYSDAFEHLELPENVVFIGSDAFYGCQNLNEIHILNKDCYIYPTAETIPSSAVIYGYPDSTAQAYARSFGYTFADVSTGRKTEYEVNNELLFSFLPKDLQAEEPGYIPGIYDERDGRYSEPDFDVFHYEKSGHKYQKLKSHTDSLLEGCKSDYDRVCKITEWVNANVTYVYGLANVDPYNVFIDSRGNCMSYASLTGYMLYLAGIPAAFVTNDSHEWNLALIDGSWMHVDSSSDTGLIKKEHGDYLQIHTIAFVSAGLGYVIQNGEGVYLAAIGYSDENAGSYESITIPDFVAGIYGSVISEANKDEYRTGEPLLVKGRAGSNVEKDVSRIYKCISYSGGSFTARESHTYHGGECRICGMEREKIKQAPVLSKTKKVLSSWKLKQGRAVFKIRVKDAKSPLKAVSGNSSIKMSCKGNLVTVTVKKGTKAGVYTVKIRAEETDGYHASNWQKLKIYVL